MEWYPHGPKVDYIPLPIPDPTQPWGSISCVKCSGFCAGHFLKPEEALHSNHAPMKEPPSMILKKFFQENGAKPSENLLEGVAKKTLLPINEVLLWLDHLKTVDDNRKRGAAKAALTRQRKRKEVQYF